MESWKIIIIGLIILLIAAILGMACIMDSKNIGKSETFIEFINIIIYLVISEWLKLIGFTLLFSFLIGIIVTLIIMLDAI